MGNEKVTIEFVGEDGAVRKVIANLKKDTQGAAKEMGTSFEAAGDKLSQAFSNGPISTLGSSLRSLPGLINPITVSIGAVGLAIKTAFDLSVAGEQLRAAEAQFDNFASASGLNGEKIRSALEQASGGLVDVDNLLKEATGAVINLGAEAEKLPQILDLARQATFALGGDIQERFTGIVNAIEAGNVRALRQQGIFLDAKKVFQQYADAVGVSVGSLDKAQQQQALLNAALAEGKKKFSGVNEDLTPLQNNLKRVGVAFDDIIDSIKKTADSNFGKAFADFFAFTAEALKVKSPFQQQATDAADMRVKIIQLEQVLKNYQNELANTGIIGKTLNFDIDTKENIRRVTAQLEELRSKFNSVATATENVSEKVKAVSGEKSPIAGFIPNEQQMAELKAAVLEVEKLSLAARTSGVQNEISAMDSITSAVAFELSSKASLNEQLDILDQQRELAVIASNDRLKNYAELRGQAELAINQDFENKKVALEISTSKKIADFKEKQDKAALQATSTALGQIATLQENASGELAQIGKAAAITKATIDGYVAVQNAFASVPYPFNFAAAALVGVATAANVAKIAAVGGGGSSEFSPSTAIGGGVNSSPTNQLPDIATQTPERRADTGIVVNIQGDVLDSEESGLRIVSLLNDAFDKKGVVIRSGAVA